jgi:exosortase/archaeosortase family protein
MDRDNSGRSTLIRTLVAGLLVFGLMQTTRTTDALSWLTRPAVAAVITVFGGHATDGGADIIIGQLRVPWSRDCAGFDVLLVLWGLILWSSRHDPVSKRFWIRMVLAVPASVLANIARVLTIVGWRQAFYPAVESPQMHYFIGFLWLLPLLALFVPRGGRAFVPYATETSLLAAALSLVAAQSAAPGGTWVSVCALLLLAGEQWRPLVGWKDQLLAVLWVGAAIFIAGAAMESLWLPWLLMCPWCFPRKWLFTPAILLIPGTVPIFAMKLSWLTLPGIATAVWLLLRSPSRGTQPSENAAALTWRGGLAIMIMLLVPFTASTVGPALQASTSPPSGLMAKMFEPGSFLLRFIGQSPDLTLTWNAPNGSGRHHTLAVCLLYRGRKIHEEPTCPGVQTDEEYWMAEAFLMPDGELYPYDGYLRATLMPFTSAGVHLIATAPRSAMSADRFKTTAQGYFSRVAALEKVRLSN